MAKDIELNLKKIFSRKNYSSGSIFAHAREALTCRKAFNSAKKFLSSTSFRKIKINISDIEVQTRATQGKIYGLLFNKEAEDARLKALSERIASLEKDSENIKTAIWEEKNKGMALRQRNI